LHPELPIKFNQDHDIFSFYAPPEYNPRITAKAPYQASSPVGADASKQATGDKTSWLGLGQEVTVVKQI